MSRTLPGSHTNRTGGASAPLLSREMLEGASDGACGVVGDSGALASVRAICAQEAGALGSLPLTSRSAGGGRPLLAFLDALSGALLLERYRARLYELLLAKLDAHREHSGEALRQQLTSMQADEVAHFELLYRVIVRLGGDPTAISPYADVLGVATSGFGLVLADPRVDLVQCMHVMVLLERTDGEQWAMLLDQSIMLGDRESVGVFRQASAVEERHVMVLRAWVARQRRGRGALGEGNDQLVAQQGARP